MLVIVGFLVVIGSVLGGFMWAGGHVGALVHPSEILVIGGAAAGAMVVMASKKKLIDLVKGCIQAIKGSPFTRKSYDELFQLQYELFRLARKEGLLALEPHLADPHESEIFNRYPTISKNHHATDFLVGALAPVVDGTIKPDRLPELLETEIKAIEEEHHGPLGVLNKTADALPGFGIVAAVLGIVITMGHIDGPVEEIGHKVGAALVGTFLGILASYGFLAPMATKLEFLGQEEMVFFRTIAVVVMGYVTELPPRIAIEQGRRGLPSHLKCSREQLEEMFKAIDTAGR
jgi:chemotaxis protein MotA